MKFFCLCAAFSFCLISSDAYPILGIMSAAKALELFLQDLCDRTYNITLKKGAKTLNSLHL